MNNVIKQPSDAAFFNGVVRRVLKGILPESGKHYAALAVAASLAIAAVDRTPGFVGSGSDFRASAHAATAEIAPSFTLPIAPPRSTKPNLVVAGMAPKGPAG